MTGMRQFHEARMPPSPPSGPPPLWLVVATAAAAVVAMIAAVFFAGQGLAPVALFGTTAFVALGGVAFELARRRAQAAERDRR
ncbi:MAG: hypothetical protein R2708_16180 [Vicinamibacterales bacterium]